MTVLVAEKLAEPPSARVSLQLTVVMEFWRCRVLSDQLYKIYRKDGAIEGRSLLLNGRYRLLFYGDGLLENI